MKKERRSFFYQLVLLVTGAISTLKVGAKFSLQTPKVLDGPFVHVVFFWLKDPENSEDREAFQEALSVFINGTPVIKTQHIGTPAETSRAVIDNSYTYSLITTFASKKEHDIYQEHPLHKEFIEKSQQLWEKVQVYDSILIA